MTLKQLEPDRSAVVFSLPILFGFVVDISAGMAITVVGIIAIAYGQLVFRHGEAKAKAHKLWIEAQNASIQPELDRAKVEREELRRMVVGLKGDLDESVRAERDLAIASLIISGNIKPRAK